MSSNESKLFAAKLRTLIHDKNMSQVEVAKAINVSPQTFNTWCKGVSLPRMGKLEAIADYFGVRPSVLIDDSIDMNSLYIKSVDALARELDLAEQLRLVLCSDPALNGYNFSEDQLMDILRYARFLAEED